MLGLLLVNAYSISLTAIPFDQGFRRHKKTKQSTVVASESVVDWVLPKRTAHIEHVPVPFPRRLATFLGCNWMEPGDSTEALLSFYGPDVQQSRLQLGSSYTLAEGRNNIALGTIVEILDQTMTNPMTQKESVIFVDVDDTLIRSFGTKQIPIPNAIRYVRDMFNAGNLLYCWSRGGAQYSREVATKLGIADCFVCFLPKPDVVVDDRLEQLLAHCEFIHPNNAVTKPEATNT